MHVVRHKIGVSVNLHTHEAVKLISQLNKVEELHELRDMLINFYGKRGIITKQQIKGWTTKYEQRCEHDGQTVEKPRRGRPKKTK